MRHSPINYAKAMIELEQEATFKDQTELVLKFKKVLEKNNDLSLIKEIETVYKNLKIEARGKVVVIIEYFGQIDKEKIQQKFDTRAEISFIEKPELQGGIRINIGDLRIDNSLKQRLENLKKIIA